MADDWQAGDLALCVKRGEWRHAVGGKLNGGRGMRSGQVHTVRRFGRCPVSGIPTLWFVDFPGNRGSDGFGACRFRKIRPLSVEERNAEIRLLTGKPVKVDA